MKNRKMMSIQILLSLFIVFSIAVSAQAAGQTYKMALSLAITGPTSDAGNPYAKGVEDYFHYVNDMKLLGDDKIDCTIRDDQYKTDVTKRNFEEERAPLRLLRVSRKHDSVKVSVNIADNVEQPSELVTSTV